MALGKSVRGRPLRPPPEAQLDEQRTLNPEGAGSIPARRTYENRIWNKPERLVHTIRFRVGGPRLVLVFDPMLLRRTSEPQHRASLALMESSRPLTGRILVRIQGGVPDGDASGLRTACKAEMRWFDSNRRLQEP